MKGQHTAGSQKQSRSSYEETKKLRSTSRRSDTGTGRFDKYGSAGTESINRAFVLMQYFGYLRRNPNDAPETTLDFQGYNFWLTKLNNLNVSFAQAEMVKAVLSSTGYRQRFGP